MAEKRRGLQRLKGLLGLGDGGEEVEGHPFHQLLEITRALVSEHQPRKLYSQILDAAVQLTGAERAFLVLTGPNGEFVVAAARNIDREEVKAPLTKISRTRSGSAAVRWPVTNSSISWSMSSLSPAQKKWSAPGSSTSLASGILEAM